VAERMWMSEAKQRLEVLVKNRGDAKDVEALDTIMSHLKWLGNERESLISCLPYDD
jgi:hypothetical protein